MTEPTELRSRPPEAWFEQAWKTVQLGQARARAIYWRGFAAGFAAALASVTIGWVLSMLFPHGPLP